MPAYSPLQPVSEALFALFQDATLQGLALGGVQTDVPEDPTYPFLWIEVIEQDQRGGFGTKPGVGALPEIGIRLHAYDIATSLEGWPTCQRLLARAVALLSATDALTITGYRVCGTEPFYDQTIPSPDSALNGVKVKELVALYRLYIEEQP